MKVTLDIEIAPFVVPTSVRLIKPSGTLGLQTDLLSLADISEETLKSLCDQFFEDIFKLRKEQTTHPRGLRTLIKNDYAHIKTEERKSD